MSNYATLVRLSLLARRCRPAAATVFARVHPQLDAYLHWNQEVFFRVYAKLFFASGWLAGNRRCTSITTTTTITYTHIHIMSPVFFFFFS